MYFLISRERYKPLSLKCLWLGEMGSWTSPAGCKLLKLFDLVYFSSFSFPIPLAQEFSYYFPVLRSSEVLSFNVFFLWYSKC